MNIRRKCIDAVVFRGLFVGHMHLFLLRFQPLRYRPSKCYGFWESPWVFIHKWLRLTHKHWKHAWHSGTCARGASWYVSINVVRVSQLLHGQWVKTLVFNNYTNASFALGIFFYFYGSYETKAAHYTRLHGAGMARYHIICSRFGLFLVRNPQILYFCSAAAWCEL